MTVSRRLVLGTLLCSLVAAGAPLTVACQAAPPAAKACCCPAETLPTPCPAECAMMPETHPPLAAGLALPSAPTLPLGLAAQASAVVLPHTASGLADAHCTDRVHAASPAVYLLDCTFRL